MDPAQEPFGLFWCENAEDMNAYGTNAVCKSLTVPQLGGHDIVHQEGVTAPPTVSILKQLEDGILVMGGFVSNIGEEQIPVEPTVYRSLHIIVHKKESFPVSGSSCFTT